jgi:hypothetical protein
VKFLILHRCQFQFLLVDSSSSGVQITIPDWVVEWDLFVKDEELRLCLPIAAGKSTLEACHVRWHKTDPETNEQFVGLVQTRKTFQEPLFKLDEFGMLELAKDGTDPRKLVLRLIKDSSVLKRGVSIYLEHFLPYFTRITRDLDHYDEVRSFMLTDTLDLVKTKIKSLELMHEDFSKGFSDQSLSEVDLQMNNLRELFKSEVSNALFKMTFPEQLLLSYVEEIKNLELRLFSNYNSLVTLYSIALENSLA